MGSAIKEIELVRAAVYAADAAKRKVVDAEKALARAKAEHADAEARLAAFVTPTRRDHETPSVSVTNDIGGATKAMMPKPIVALEDESVPKKYRIAFMLLADPVLDYQETAARLWPPTDPKTAKNRVNAQVQQLRKEQIVKTLGSNRFAVDAVKLAEKSGIPTAEASVTNQ